jgi:uncharacterized protein (DUF433 family)
MSSRSKSLVWVAALAVGELITAFTTIALLLYAGWTDVVVHSVAAAVSVAAIYSMIGLTGVLGIALLYGATSALLRRRDRPFELGGQLINAGTCGIALYLVLIVTFFAYLQIASIHRVKLTSYRTQVPSPGGAVPQLEPVPQAVPAEPASGRGAVVAVESVPIIAAAPSITSNWIEMLGLLLAGGIIALSVRALVAFLRRRGRFWNVASGLGKGIEKTEGVCGGDARIAGTRIPVWQLVEIRDMGLGEAEILRHFPDLRPEDLSNAWSYAKAHADEIRAEIHENEVA